MQSILDYETYNAEMVKGLIDKAFFLDKIDANLFVDFGCADGALIDYMSTLFPDNSYIGYDFDREMLNKAWQRKIDKGVFTDEWNIVKNLVQSEAHKDKKKAVICNSLIHEVYAYGTEYTIPKFWDRIFNSGFDYICIRDMALKDNIVSMVPDSRYLSALYNNEKIALRLKSFEAIWGPVSNPENYIHFLMKYRYEKNWSREVMENYFPLKMNDFFKASYNMNYRMTFFDHSPHPFTVRKVKEDLGIDINRIDTHVKMILEKI